MIKTKNLPVIVDQDTIRQANIELEKKERKIKEYKTAMKKLEDFLTYIYHNSDTFRKLKERFNEINEDCRIRLEDNKVKIEVYEKDNS